MPFHVLYYTHIDTWGITLLVFFISFFLATKDKLKAQKITHMILRLLFVVMFVTGFGLVIFYKFALITIIKMLFALWLIASMEMILVKARKNEPAAAVWVQFVFAAAATIVIGYQFI